MQAGRLEEALNEFKILVRKPQGKRLIRLGR
jgi:hypothetical protein